MKKFTIQAILLLILIFGGIIFFTSGQTPGKIDIPFLPQSPTLKNIQIKDIILKVEVADTNTKRNKGLGSRESLASDSGMLFILGGLGNYPFWMKGMKFPLDFIWIRDNQVVDIMRNIPAPSSGQKDQDLPVYQSKMAVDKILEVNSGTADRLNIKIGDTLKLP